MILKQLISVIREINGGSFLPSTSDEDSQYCLDLSEVMLFADANGKHYYFAEFTINEDGSDNFSEIESAIFEFHDKGQIERPLPCDAYLVLLYEVDEISEDAIKTVISIEENEFLFHKFVMYYTKNEYDEFEKWVNDQPSKKVEDLLATEDLSDMLLKSEVSFFLRLLIKVPFMPMTF